MMIKIKGISKREFKKKLLSKTGCGIQNKGWTCGTCFFAISQTLKNYDWVALLIYRGDYDINETNEWLKEDGQSPLTKTEIENSIKKIWELIK